MNRLLNIFLIVLITGCASRSADKKNSETGFSITSSHKELDTIIDSDSVNAEGAINHNNATFFVVVADTNINYYLLDKKMLDLNKRIKIPVDTMGRSYNKKKNLIALRDDDKNQMYAGAYYPRRFPSENLSLEYLNIYQHQAGEKTIALVTGIYKSENSADSALSALKKIEKKSFKIKTDMYVGYLY